MDIDECRGRADCEQSRRGVKTSIGDCGHTRAWLHTYRPQGQFQGIRSIPNSDADFSTAVCREVLFKALAFTSEDVPTAIQDTLHGRSNKLLGGCKMALHVIDRNAHDALPFCRIFSRCSPSLKPP
jgi:hypothetical protein